MNLFLFVSLFVNLFYPDLGEKEHCTPSIVVKEKKQIEERQKLYKFTTKLDNETIINYWAYVPDDYHKNPSKNYPLLIFLHGGDESGSNAEKVKRNGPPKLIEKGESFPFIVISPQLPYKFASKWRSDLVDEIYEDVKKSFRVSEKQFYLTGISLGGAGTWNYAIDFPEKVAAIVPISGWGISHRACEMKEVPTWAFHGEKDSVIKIIASSHMVDALKKCGGNPRFTRYPNAGHDAWSETYNNPKVYEWLISHTNSRPSGKARNDEKDAPLKAEKGTAKKEKRDESLNLKILTKLPLSVKESSGLVVTSNNSVWTHNDSGNTPVLFNIDSSGKVIQIKRISNATNLDWETITKDGESNFYIGDVGNNAGKRKKLQIYKITDPEINEQERISAELIEFAFEDQKDFPPSRSSLNFDIEAMVHLNQHIYLFTKNNTQPYSGICKMYRVPASPGNYVAELIDSVKLGESVFESSVTGASLTTDNKHLVLLSYSKLYVFSCFKGDSFFSGLKNEYILPFVSQKEAVDVLDGRYLYITDENFHNIGSNLYYADINHLLIQNCP